MVPVGGLEPPRIAATDFESVVYTNFTTLAQLYRREKEISLEGVEYISENLLVNKCLADLSQKMQLLGKDIGICCEFFC